MPASLPLIHIAPSGRWYHTPFDTLFLGAFLAEKRRSDVVFILAGTGATPMLRMLCLNSARVLGALVSSACAKVCAVISSDRPVRSKYFFMIAFLLFVYWILNTNQVSGFD